MTVINDCNNGVGFSKQQNPPGTKKPPIQIETFEPLI
jgi:hypothetical protein